MSGDREGSPHQQLTPSELPAPAPHQSHDVAPGRATLHPTRHTHHPMPRDPAQGQAGGQGTGETPPAPIIAGADPSIGSEACSRPLSELHPPPPILLRVDGGRAGRASPAAKYVGRTRTPYLPIVLGGECVGKTRSELDRLTLTHIPPASQPSHLISIELFWNKGPWRKVSGHAR